MTDTVTTLRDGNNNAINVKTRTEVDGSLAFYHASDAEINQPDNSVVGMIGTTMSKFSDGFSGPTLAAGQATLDSLGKWNIVRNTGGMTVQQINGALTIATGTVAAEFLMVGKTQCTIPQNLTAIMSMTARSANQETRVGYLEVDADGVPVPNPNLTGFFNNHTAVLVSGTVATAVTLETLSGSNPTTKTVLVASQNASTGTVEYALEVRPEDVTYQQVLADSVTAKAIGSARVSSMVPNPLVRYAPFIWVRNTGVATNNVITVQRIISMDIQELQVEVGGGRGNLAASQAIPVAIVSSPVAVSVNGSTVTVSNATLSVTTNGALLAKVVSTATTNATLVKAAAGKIYGGSITNTGTTTAYLKLYAQVAIPVVGTTVPILTIPLLPNFPVNLSDIVDQYGIYCIGGIGYGITGGYLENDTTAIAAGQVLGFFLYI